MGSGSYNTIIGHDAGGTGGSSAYPINLQNTSRNIMFGTDELAALYLGDDATNHDTWYHRGGLGYVMGATNGATPSDEQFGNYGMFHTGSDNDSNVRLRISVRVDEGGTYEYPVLLHLQAGACDSSGGNNTGAWWLIRAAVHHNGTVPAFTSGPTVVDSGGDTANFSLAQSNGGSLGGGNALQWDIQITESGSSEVFYNAWFGGRTWANRMWRISS
jgi:hypothetical protein